MNASISEIIVILLIALVVIRPERMPEVAFTLGQMARSIRRMLTRAKDEMNDFMGSVEKSGEQKREQQ